MDGDPDTGGGAARRDARGLVRAERQAGRRRGGHAGFGVQFCGEFGNCNSDGF